MNISGAKWWKFDFHTHSMASKDYGKDDEELKELSPREWLLEFMKKEIDCIAITDHNTGALIDNFKNELIKMKEEGCTGYRDLYIFPGVEITVNGGIHLLGIFDISHSSEDIAEIMGAIKYKGTRGHLDGCTELSFEQVVDEIVKNDGIAIPAHVDIDNGLFTQQTGVTLRNSLSKEQILAIELHDSDFNKPQVYKDLKINFTEVIGSDCHKPEHVGRYFTWVKMGNPSLNALWLALHDGKDGILRYDSIEGNPNDITDRFFIKNLSVKNGARIGRGKNFEVGFSPWMSTIIGGRGSGKSSILNYIRLVLDGKRNLTEKLKSEFDDFARISDGRGALGMLLTDTEIRIEMLKDGRDIALVWKNWEITEEIYDLNESEWISKGEALLVNDRFPVRMFSQKELYEITRDPKVLLILIDQQYNKTEIDSEINVLSQQFYQLRTDERLLSKSILNKKNILTELDDIKAKMKIFEESNYKKILEDFRNVQEVDKSIKNIHNEYINNVEQINTCLETIADISISESLKTLLDATSINDLTDIVSKFNEFIANLTIQSKKANQLAQEWEVTIDKLPWNINKNEIEIEYGELVKKLQEKGEKDTNVYEELVNKKHELENKVTEIEKIELEKKDKSSDSLKLYKKIINKHKEIRDKRKNVIDEWNSINKNIKLEIEVMGDMSDSETEFRNIIRKSGEVYKKDILEYDDENRPLSGLIYDICNYGEKEAWIKRHEILSNVIKCTETDTKGYGKAFIRHITEISRSTPEDIDRLWMWIPQDVVNIKLIDNGKEFNVEVGSAGQRTAAILSLILSLEDTPLIIDQPEDDLDTKRISDLVVSGIRTLKNNQQVIVVTHNPNIPVNGGAEQIIHLGFNAGNIRVQNIGALQKQEVRQAVCDIMEGGKTALSNRYYRISKALENDSEI